MTEQTKVNQGSTLFSVVVKPDQVAHTIEVIKKKADNKCLIATQEEGAMVKVEAILFSHQPTGPDGMAKELNEELHDQLGVTGKFQEGVAEKELEF